ncbi:hypothetical protein [Nocardia abscessus]|uniref:hypothetical protein n=1 Tax=Nocardia abscessus TaxID=120957 RepID=UPI0024557EE8|nr:hypothetical protein [Nocardia abscessus]
MRAPVTEHDASRSGNAEKLAALDESIGRVGAGGDAARSHNGDLAGSHTFAMPSESVSELFVGLYSAGPSRSDVPEALAPHFAFPEGPDEAPIAALHCSVTSINRRGRLSAKSLLGLLGWGPGQRFVFEVDQTLVKVRRSGVGWPLGNDGFLVLPADVRNRSNINAGDRILMAASLQHDLLVVYPPKALTAALWACYPNLWGKAS